MSFPLVGLVGPKYSGKSTAASMLVETLEYSEKAFADPLRTLASAMFDLNEYYFKSENKEKPGPLGVSYRRGMQVAGDLFRGINDRLPELECKPGEIFIKLMDQAIIKNFNDGVKTVVSDVRFVEEADFIIKKGGLLVYVLRPSLDPIDANDHRSETGVLKIWEKYFAGEPSDKCRVLTNCGDMEELKKLSVAIVDGYSPQSPPGE